MIVGCKSIQNVFVNMASLFRTSGLESVIFTGLSEILSGFERDIDEGKCNFDCFVWNDSFGICNLA